MNTSQNLRIEEEHDRVVRDGALTYTTQKYPVFGPDTYDETCPPKSVTDSPYYWWFRFLQLNEGYARAKDDQHSKYRAIYDELGDVRGVDFKSWWEENRYLFMELHEHEMHIAKDVNDLARFDDELAVNVVVPMTLDRVTLLRLFKELVLSRIPDSDTDPLASQRMILYNLAGKWNINAMAIAYQVYRLREQSVHGHPFPKSKAARKESDEATKAKLTWADIAIRADLRPELRGKEGVKSAATSDERRIATILAMRHYRRAQQYIEAAASRTFPH
jgi:hypothetical protein